MRKWKGWYKTFKNGGIYCEMQISRSFCYCIMSFLRNKNVFVLNLTLGVSSWGGEEDGSDGCSTLIRYPKHRKGVYKNEKKISSLIPN